MIFTPLKHSGTLWVMQSTESRRQCQTVTDSNANKGSTNRGAIGIKTNYRNINKYLEGIGKKDGGIR
jgi:hypothetical protein